MESTTYGQEVSNLRDKHQNGDVDAMAVLTAIEVAKPIDTYILFMGFCPGADVNERLDVEWKERGICRFDYPESAVQVERFNSICVGDLVILKKIARFGKTMTLHGSGRVKRIAYDENNVRFFVMDWSNHSDVIEVPLMGAGSTVNIKSMESVEESMPDEFHAWLGRNDCVSKA